MDRPDFSFCEPAWATGIRWHIRPVINGTLFPTGGIPTELTTLCDLDLQRGWDIQVDVRAESVALLLERDITSRSPAERMICGACAREYQSGTAGAIERIVRVSEAN